MLQKNRYEIVKLFGRNRRYTINSNTNKRKACADAKLYSGVHQLTFVVMLDGKEIARYSDGKADNVTKTKISVFAARFNGERHAGGDNG